MKSSTSITHILKPTNVTFSLTRGQDRNAATVSLNEPLQGPQDISLELVMRFKQRPGLMSGRAVAKLTVHIAEQEEIFAQ